MKKDRSNALLKKYDAIIPGGVHSNFRKPVYFKKAKGPYIWDVDDERYLDIMVSNGACILGHGDPDVTEAVREAVQHGITIALESELSLEIGRQLHEMIPSAEQVRLANSGTEAVMKALMIARASTGKEKIIKMEGAYHGWHDEAQISVHPNPSEWGPIDLPRSVPSTTGIKHNTAESVIVVSYNDLDQLERVLRIHEGQIAAVIIEPVLFNSGCILPEDGYLAGVRKLTEQFRVVLIFDEIITGFRLAPGGAQERFGVIPDLSVFAKAIANGYPLSAVVGRKDLMELTRPGKSLTYGGTYNGHYAVLAAAAACLEKVKSGAVQQHLTYLTNRLALGFNQTAQNLGVAARIQECRGEFQIYFTKKEVKTYRDAWASDRTKYEVFYNAVADKGIWMSPNYLFHHGVTYSHGDEEIDQILKAFTAGLGAVKSHQ